MTKIRAIIESLENNYSAYIEMLDGVVATGYTIAEIKANLLDAIDDYIQTCKENGFEVPEELQSEYKIEFTMDVKTLLNMYERIFSKSGLERLTGINQKQLWHYANGKSVPRRAQVLKLEDALHRLGTELMSITL